MTPEFETRQQPGKEYELEVQEFTSGTSQIIQGREIDCVTLEALIQAKNSESAIDKPHNFLNKKTRKQIKETISLATELRMRAEFWFKKNPHPDVRKYIEDKQGIVIIWSKE